jgi:hypothetical protein
MIKVTNQEEFEKCLPMLDSTDVECRLLGWELLCGCTDLHRDSLLVWNYGTKCPLLRFISKYDRFVYSDKFLFKTMLYSSLIKDFTIASKIYLDTSTYIKLK